MNTHYNSSSFQHYNSKSTRPTRLNKYIYLSNGIIRYKLEERMFLSKESGSIIIYINHEFHNYFTHVYTKANKNTSIIISDLYFQASKTVNLIRGGIIINTSLNNT